jgi:excisionase family DNA binding protein
MTEDKVVTVSEGWIGSQEAAKLTGYTVRYLCKLARDGRLRATKLGRDWLFERESLLKWKERMNKLGAKKHSPKAKRIKSSPHSEGSED